MKKGSKKFTSIMLTLVLTVTMIPMGSVINPKDAKAAMFSNPRIVQDSGMTAGQKVTWDCVWFGSYPQAEVVPSGEYTALDKSITQDGDIIVSDSTYNALKNATGWNGNGDITLNGAKYRRIKNTDATYSGSSSSYYNWSDSDTYHYFKYEPIKWRVLNINGNDAFLLADKGLDDQQYNTSYTSVTWERSTIRSWLNGYGVVSNACGTDYSNKNFIDTAFSGTEQSAVKTTSVVNNDNIDYGTDGGNNTNDKVFLLSESEVYTDSAKSYGFVSRDSTDDEARRSKSSTYAKAMGTYSATSASYAGNCWWWLRSPGSDTDDAARVDSYGCVDGVGGSVDNDDGAVRPALHLNLSSSNLYFYAGTVCSDGSKNETGSGSVDIGGGNSETDGPLKLSGAIYKYGTTTKNLLTEVHSIETNHDKFQLTCTANDAGSVKEYQLYSGNKKIATSREGEFLNLDPEKFTKDAEVSVKTVGKSKTVTTTLLLQIKEESILQGASIGLGGEALSFTVPDSVPILGGSKLNFSLPEIPVNAVIEDGKIKIGFNIKEKNLYSSNSYEGVTTTTKNKTMAQKVADWKADMYKSGLLANDMNGYLEQANLKADIPAVSESCKMTVFGYAEATWSDSLETVSGEIVVAISASATGQQQFAILNIPVTVNIKVTGKGQVGAKIGYNFVKNEVSGNVDLNMSVALEPYLGVGVGTWFSAGVYGQAEAGMKMNLISGSTLTGGKGPGLDSVYLYGEAGLKAYFAKKEVARVPIVSTKNLKNTSLGSYLNSSNQLLLYSRTENSVLNKINPVPSYRKEKTVPLPNVNEMDMMFEWSESTKSQYIAPVPNLLETEEANILIDNVYGASTPKIATVGNKTIIAYVDEDTKRVNANETKAQYIIYDRLTETFTEPMSIYDDGTADFNLQIASDGKNVYVYYLDSTKIFGAGDDPDMDEYAGTFGITVAKFDSTTNSFIHLGKLQVNNKYCYAPSLVPAAEGFILSWAENNDNQLMGLTDTNSVYYVVYDGRTVSTPEKVVEHQNSITSLVAVPGEDGYKIGYCVDLDNDLTTQEQRFHIQDIDGENHHIATGIISSLEYTSLPGVDQKVIALIDNGILSFVNSKTNEISILDETARVDNGSKYTVVGDNIYYLHTTTTFEENSRNVTMLSYGDKAFHSVEVTNETDYVDGYATDGKWMVYQSTKADIGENDDINTSYQLKINSDLEKHDLALDYADYDFYELKPSANLPVTLGITNHGTTTVTGVRVTVCDEKGTIVNTSDLEVEIAPGNAITKQIDVRTPESLKGKVYTIRISEINKSDAKDSDNEAMIDFSLTDLSVNATYVINETDNKYIKANVSNDSYIDTDATITVTDADGKSVYDGTLTIEGTGSQDVLVPVTEDMIANENSESIYTITVTTEDNEFYNCNNICDVGVWDVEPVKTEIRDNEIIAKGIEINGYQMNATASGMRTVYSVEPEINNQKVVNSGIIYALRDYVEESDLYIGNDNYYVKSFESTMVGLSVINYSNSVTADSYVMTMRFATKTAAERTCEFLIRAYAELEDGSYVYSDACAYDTFRVAKYLYDNSLMWNRVSHDCLYENVLRIVDDEYIKIPYNHVNSIVQAD